MGKRKIDRYSITYLRDDIEIDNTNRRLYHGTIVKVNRRKLQRAYELLTTITDQHVNPLFTSRGVSHHFKYREFG